MSEVDALFLTKYDRKGASSRYRSLQYFPRFESAGIQCTYEPLFSDQYLSSLYKSGNRPLGEIFRCYFRRLRSLLDVRKFDVIVLEKELFPYLPALFERILGVVETPYIVDYDDAVFHNYDLSTNLIVRRLIGRKIDVVMREAEVVVAGNEYLASRADEAGAPRIEIVPTVVDLHRYPHVPPDDAGPLTIGWIGSPQTIKYVRHIEEALEKTCEQIDAIVSLVGSGPVEFDGFPVEVVTWSEQTEIQSLGQFDVGVMPLADGPWESGKCNLKLIQYMATGIPVVASPVGASNSMVTDGFNGYFASSQGEWVRRLSLLATDSDLARRLGKNGRRLVERKYCLSATAPKLIDVIKSITR